MELQYGQQSQDYEGLWGNNNPSLINHSFALASVINLRLECTITVKTTAEWPIHTFAVSHLLFPSISIRSLLPSGFSLYSSCASLPLRIPCQLSPPAYLTSNHLWSKLGPTGTRHICTNTLSYLNGSEKHHSKTKKKRRSRRSIPSPVYSQLHADHNLFAQMKREEESWGVGFNSHLTNISQQGWKGTAVIFGQPKHKPLVLLFMICLRP